jgi:hypothetical protein
MLLLGLLYNFQLISFFLVYIPLLIFLLYLNRKNLSIPKFKSPANKKFILIVFPFILLSLMHILLFPELYKDSLIYGQWARILFQEKKINFVEGGPTLALGFASNYPSAYQLLGAFVYLFTGENLIFLRLVSLLISFLLIFLAYFWSREIFGEKLSIYSVLLFISLPFIIFFSHSASQYIYLTFQFSLACYFLQKFLLEKNKKYLFLSSIFGGFAALTSYLGLLYVLFLPFVFKLDKKYYKTVLFSVVLFFAVISPWYLRNLIVLNNPIWPFGGGRYIDPIIQSNSLYQLHIISKFSGFNYDSLADLKNSFQRLFFSYVDYYNASVYQGLNPIFILLAIPAIFVWLEKKDKKMGFFIFWFIIILIFYILEVNYWDRYLILISVPTVFISVYLINLLIKFKTIKWLLILFFARLYLNSLFLTLFWDECPGGDKKTFLQTLENLGNHEKILEICYGNDAKLWKWVNENLPKNATIAVADFKLYYFNRTVIETTSWKLRNIFYASEIREVMPTFKENNISYLITMSEDIDKYPQYFELVENIGGRRVYKIV